MELDFDKITKEMMDSSYAIGDNCYKVMQELRDLAMFVRHDQKSLEELFILSGQTLEALSTARATIEYAIKIAANAKKEDDND